MLNIVVSQREACPQVRMMNEVGVYLNQNDRIVEVYPLGLLPLRFMSVVGELEILAPAICR